jgi:hypothetical protein
MKYLLFLTGFLFMLMACSAGEDEAPKLSAFSADGKAVIGDVSLVVQNAKQVISALKTKLQEYKTHLEGGGTQTLQEFLSADGMPVIPAIVAALKSLESTLTETDLVAEIARLRKLLEGGAAQGIRGVFGIEFPGIDDILVAIPDITDIPGVSGLIDFVDGIEDLIEEIEEFIDHTGDIIDVVFPDGEPPNPHGGPVLGNSCAGWLLVNEEYEVVNDAGEMVFCSRVTQLEADMKECQKNACGGPVIKVNCLTGANADNCPGDQLVCNLITNFGANPSVKCKLSTGTAQKAIFFFRCNYTCDTPAPAPAPEPVPVPK